MQWSREQVERDLALTLRSRSAVLELGVRPPFEIEIENRSRDATYTVVRSGDGSDVPGEREPFVGFRVERKLPGAPWEDVSSQPETDCYAASEWWSDAVELAPGLTTRMTSVQVNAALSRQLASAERVRFTASYVYGDVDAPAHRLSASLARMPRYELSSNPLDLPVMRPVALRLRVQGALPRGPGEPLRAALEVVAENRSDAPIASTHGREQNLWVTAEIARADGRQESALLLAIPPDEAGDVGALPRTTTIAPGERAQILGPDAKTSEGWSLEPGDRVLDVRGVWWLRETDAHGRERVRSVDSRWD